MRISAADAATITASNDRGAGTAAAIRPEDVRRRRGRTGRRSGRTRITVAVVAVLTLFATWFVSITAAIVFPHEDAPAHVDAIVVLGGLDGDRVIDEALRLADDGYSTRIVLSTSFGWNKRAADLCDAESAFVIDCFTPDPNTTQGEARAIARLADSEGWTSVMVVTAPYHVTRAQLIVARCFSGNLIVRGPNLPMSREEWIHQYLYQSGAFVKAWINRTC